MSAGFKRMLTGQNIFIVTFDLNLPPPANPDATPNATDDLGFVAPTRPEFPADSTLDGGVFLQYEAVGNLMYWDPATGEWSDNVPGSTQVTLSGGFQVVFNCQLIVCVPVDLSRCGGLPCETNFRESGVVGDPTLALGETFSNGGLHVHPNFFLEDFNGNAGGPPGAYMVQIRMTADGLAPSDPFFIMLFKGLNTEQEANALIARIGGAIISEPRQVPMLQPLYLGLLLVLTLGAGIRRYRSLRGSGR